MNTDYIENLLKRVKTADVTIDEAIEKLRHLPYQDIGFARIDHHRQIRCGFPEVIYCPGKTTEHIVEIFTELAKQGNNVLATRAEREIYDAIVATGKFPTVRYEELARMIVLEQGEQSLTENYVVIVTAGTADMPVAMEAKVTCECMGQSVEMICDIGVAGIHRLLGSKETLATLHDASVVIVVAGMEGALASVVGGLVDSPVVAVPTSVGYGASFEGLAALLAMLNSCASGVTVVNIDNGFGAGYSAAIINRKIEESGGGR
jgi:hypothetical protein